MSEVNAATVHRSADQAFSGNVNDTAGEEKKEEESGTEPATKMQHQRRMGSRDGSRDGSRTGSREGSRASTPTGTTKPTPTIATEGGQNLLPPTGPTETKEPPAATGNVVDQVTANIKMLLSESNKSMLAVFDQKVDGVNEKVEVVSGKVEIVSGQVGTLTSNCADLQAQINQLKTTAPNVATAGSDEAPGKVQLPGSTRPLNSAAAFDAESCLIPASLDVSVSSISTTSNSTSVFADVAKTLEDPQLLKKKQLQLTTFAAATYLAEFHTFTTQGGQITFNTIATRLIKEGTPEQSRVLVHTESTKMRAEPRLMKLLGFASTGLEQLADVQLVTREHMHWVLPAALQSTLEAVTGSRATDEDLRATLEGIMMYACTLLRPPHRPLTGGDYGKLDKELEAMSKAWKKGTLLSLFYGVSLPAGTDAVSKTTHQAALEKLAASERAKYETLSKENAGYVKENMELQTSVKNLTAENKKLKADAAKALKVQTAQVVTTALPIPADK